MIKTLVLTEPLLHLPLPPPSSSYLYLLVGVVDHGDEHVEQHHHHGDVVDAVQDVADVLDELVVVLQHHGDYFRETKDGPEESLETLLYAATKK